MSRFPSTARTHGHLGTDVHTHTRGPPHTHTYTHTQHSTAHNAAQGANVLNFNRKLQFCGQAGGGEGGRGEVGRAPLPRYTNITCKFMGIAKKPKASPALSPSLANWCIIKLLERRTKHCARAHTLTHTLRHTWYTHAHTHPHIPIHTHTHTCG